MCELCGCSQYIERGKEAVMARAAEIVSELKLTARNADDYEHTEILSHLIAPFGAPEDDIYRTAAWVANLHLSNRQAERYRRYQAHISAFQDIFSRLPAQGEPKHIVTIYHQLEQLGRQLNEEELASLTTDTKEAIRAVNHVHEGIEVKIAGLKQRYGL